MIERRPIEISTGIVIRTILIVLGVWFLYLIRDVIALVFIAFIIHATIEPFVNFLQRYKIPRSVGVLIMYFLLLCIVAAVIFFLIPPLVGQFKNFSQQWGSDPGTISHNYWMNFEAYLHSKNINIDTQHIAESVSRSLSNLPENIFFGTLGIFSGVVSILVVFTMAFYMTVNRDGMKRFIAIIVPEAHEKYAFSVVERVKNKIGKWMNGQLLLMFIIFLLDFAGLSFIGIPYALTLAIFAGLMEIIPYMGPVISAIPGVILGFIISPVTGFLVLGLYILAQQFETHIIVPQVMKKAVGLNPIAVIVALLIGLKLGGVMGAVLSIPIATTASIFLGDLLDKKE